MKLIRRLRSCRGLDFGRGATPQEIQLAEERLSVGFPASHRAFLIQVGWVSLEGMEIYGLREDVPAHLDLVRLTSGERTEVRPRIPGRLIPLMNDGAGNHYCLDVGSREQGECPVVFWDHNLGNLKTPNTWRPTWKRGYLRS